MFSNGKHLNLVDHCLYLGSNILSTENKVIMHIGKVWIAIDWLSAKWKCKLSNKKNQEVFKAVAEWVLPDSCTTWTLTKHLQKNLDDNYAICYLEQIQQL